MGDVVRDRALTNGPTPPPRRPNRDPWWVRWGLTALALAALTVLVVVPVASVFYEALREGAGPYWDALVNDPDTLAAVRLTLTVVPSAVLANLAFGVAAAWAVARFRFWGRTALVTLIDLPFSVSPVVAGLVFVLLFGAQGYFGGWLQGHGFRFLFATPALIVTTTFVTLPFIARELIPVMEAVGAEEELAAVSLGANGWQLFWKVTLPNIQWGLLYGLILCNARAMGEFGAVSVVSGRITGQTDTLPLRVEKLFQEFRTPASFAVASVLTLLAVLTLLLKVAVERQQKRRDADSVRGSEDADRRG